MKILVTRPKDDAEETAAWLSSLGHDALVAPLLEIRFRGGPEISLDHVQAILVTSANGVRALAQRTARRDIPVFCVGGQTTEAARAAGFQTAKSADGDAVALADAVKDWARPEKGALFHARGAQAKAGLAEALNDAGFTVRSEIVYEAAALPRLPRAAADALNAGTLGGALFFSPRSARIFADAVKASGCEAACAGLTAFCISPAVADALAPLAFADIRVAARQSREGIAALLE